MIAVELFGSDCGGAVHCAYDDGREDWKVLPFRDDLCQEVRRVGTQRFLARGQRKLALYDAEERRLVGILPFGHSRRVTISQYGDRIVLSGQVCEGRNGLAVYDAADLKEVLRIEDPALVYVAPVYEQSDGTLVAGGRRAQDGCQVTYLIRRGEAGRSAMKLVGDRGPQAPGSKCWLDPSGRRLAALSAARVERQPERRPKTYGIVIDIWNVDTLEIEGSVVVDRLAPQLHHFYWGQDRYRRGDANAEAWRDYLDGIEQATRSEALATNLFRLEGEDRDRCAKLRAFAVDFLRDTLKDLTWEPDGGAFWVLFSSGILRRVTLEGSLSPRYIIERFATPPALGARRWDAFPPWKRQLPWEVACLSDNCLEIVGFQPDAHDSRCRVRFDPRELGARANRLRRFLPKALWRSYDRHILREGDDGYVALPPGRTAEMTSDLVQQRRAFELEMIETEVPLASLSGEDCIAALDWLKAAIAERFPELVCYIWFRPVFVLPTPASDGAATLRRLDEVAFFARLAEEIPEAAPSLERLLDAYLDAAANLSPPVGNDFYGPDEETPAMVHALKALILLEPLCTATLRRFILSSDIEHAGCLNHEIARVFNEANGWRDPDALSFGYAWMVALWRGGSSAYATLWHDLGLGVETQLRLSPAEFCRLLMKELADQLRDGADGNDLFTPASFLTAVEKELVDGTTVFDCEVREAIQQVLSREAGKDLGLSI
ncbi:hypothetical protein [Pelagibius sp. 7325]|uniref:hypothetical protein n=1 Tax=Pelagibius sp. 7325 TaxID=3131994 RepID=UPI0030EB3543